MLRSDNFAEDVKIVLRAINLFSLPCDVVCVSTSHGCDDVSVSYFRRCVVSELGTCVSVHGCAFCVFDEP